MDKNFIELTQKMIKEQGKDVLNNKNLTKALLLDYSHREYKNEINLLLKTIELGYPKKIKETKEIDIIEIALSRKLTEEYFIVERMAFSIVSLLISLIRDDKCYNATTENMKGTKNKIDNIRMEVGNKDNNNGNVIDNKRKNNINKLLSMGWSSKEISNTIKITEDEIYNLTKE
jgi:hypothetical protein